MTALMDACDQSALNCDRRTGVRYPFEENVHYRAAGKTGIAGNGRMINIGSEGMLFTAEHALAVGKRVEVSVNWPVLLDGTTPLKFVATAIVIRSAENRVAVRIVRHEFRTRASRPLVIPPTRPQLPSGRM